jgi:hypothetical protein
MFFLSDSCSEKLNITIKDTGSGRVNMSWAPLTIDPLHNTSAHPTYLVFYNSTIKDVNNFTLATNVTSAMIDYLSPNTLYSVQVIAFFSSSIVEGCSIPIKTCKCE